MNSPHGDTTVTAIVVGYNHAHCLGRCFDALFGSRGLDALQVVYVDNGSTDSSVACTSWHPEIEVVPNEKNLGFATAVNQGLFQAAGEFVALVNPDTAVGPDVLRELVDHLRAHPEVGLVGPALFDEQGNRQVSLAPYPSLRRLAVRRLGRGGRAPWLVGAMVVARRELLQDLGGLNEEFFVYGEDMELSYRVQQRGLSVVVDDAVHITHTGNPRWSPDRLVRTYGGYMRFCGLHRPRTRVPPGAALSLLWLLRGRWAGAGVGELRRGLHRMWSQARDKPPKPGPY